MSRHKQRGYKVFEEQAPHKNLRAESVQIAKSTQFRTGLSFDCECFWNKWTNQKSKYQLGKNGKFWFTDKKVVGTSVDQPKINNTHAADPMHLRSYHVILLREQF